jgi:hypothetical protein
MPIFVSDVLPIVHCTAIICIIVNMSMFSRRNVKGLTFLYSHNTLGWVDF